MYINIGRRNAMDSEGIYTNRYYQGLSTSTSAGLHKVTLKLRTIERALCMGNIHTKISSSISIDHISPNLQQTTPQTHEPLSTW
ncbi:hypothetical protein VTL71DRAFT_1989 [Oculimacula yallundae]|uniref:Uncharacterized protein n=1 Tax=Oculimacula yallundae TaxID=86028 RepID=A0ABR4CEI6_9HELO